jgi:hypothetical protein
MRRLADIAYFATDVCGGGGGSLGAAARGLVADQQRRGRGPGCRARLPAQLPTACALLRPRKQVDVLRDGRFSRLPSPALVPGDIIVVEPGTLACDAVLLAGEAIVDENMLTGESVPVRKVREGGSLSTVWLSESEGAGAASAGGGRRLGSWHEAKERARPSARLPPCPHTHTPPLTRQVTYSPSSDGLSYGPDRSAACTLYGGTCVAQARAPKGQKSLAMVVRTRFYSAKGQLLRCAFKPARQSGSSPAAVRAPAAAAHGLPPAPGPPAAHGRPRPLLPSPSPPPPPTTPKQTPQVHPVPAGAGRGLHIRLPQVHPRHARGVHGPLCLGRRRAVAHRGLPIPNLRALPGYDHGCGPARAAGVPHDRDGLLHRPPPPRGRVRDGAAHDHGRGAAGRGVLRQDGHAHGAGPRAAGHRAGGSARRGTRRGATRGATRVGGAAGHVGGSAGGGPAGTPPPPPRGRPPRPRPQRRADRASAVF